MPRAFLFDIDNTLLYTGGAGSLAMNMAFQELYGVADAFARVEFTGRSDLYILQEGLALNGIEGRPEDHVESFTRCYCSLLPKTLREREGYLMPGFPQILEALSGEPDVRIGLATGNFSESARIKLQHYGLSSFFSGGGFGEDDVDRARVVKRAIERVADGARPAEVFVIGDTQHDITSALANGVVAVGVATGSQSAKHLQAAGAHLVFTDFSDWRSAAAKLLARA